MMPALPRTVLFISDTALSLHNSGSSGGGLSENNNTYCCLHEVQLLWILQPVDASDLTSTLNNKVLSGEDQYLQIAAVDWFVAV
jgi:hypothetical protein